MDTSSLYNLERLIAFRHELHLNPELSFQEFNTQKRIIAYLQSLGIPNENIKPCAGTGLVVDLVGTAPSQGEKRTIAFRADIDALKMNEQNEGLPYRSTNGVAHMCGHDGHVTCLLGFASLFLDQILSIPNNKTIRLLFQPAEENIGGAIVMIKEGCLDGVDEVYGCHQWPTGKIGQVWVKPGPMMSDPIILTIKIIGRGGHASEPHKFINPVMLAARFLVKIHEIFTQIQQSGTPFTFCFPTIHAGETHNVIPDFANLCGMIRSLEDGFGEKAKVIITDLLNEITSQSQASYELVVGGDGYRLTSNTEAEASHVKRLGEQFFGPGNAHPGPCPVYASEDFGWFNHTIPGAFFFLSSGKEENNNPMLHQTNFNFNDDLIDLASRFYLLIARDRLYV